MLLRGRVAVASKLAIAGWALSPDDDTHRPELEIMQAGRVILVTIPNIADADIRPVLKLSRSPGHNLCRWRITLPFSSGIQPDQPFTIRFRETGQPLEQGSDLVLSLFENGPHSGRKIVEDYVFVTASYSQEGNAIVGSLYAAALGLDEASAVLNGAPVAGGFKAAGPAAGMRSFGHPGTNVPYACVAAEGGHACVSLDLRRSGSASTERLRPVKALYIPDEVFDPSLAKSKWPDQENIRRVAGKIDTLHFLVGGYSQLMQMNSLSVQHFGRAFSDYETVCDWGVGCGRLLRYFPGLATAEGRKPQNLYGFDIDQHNIDWCKQNIPFGSFGLLDKDVAHIPLEAESVDLLYGISVMTHLSEFNQNRWLDALQRIMRPGGCVILTINGDVSLYQNPELVQFYFTQKFGFSDLQPDTTFGEDLSSYYRVTYQTQGFIHNEWSKYFDVLEIVPAKQDYVVMRRRG